MTFFLAQALHDKMLSEVGILILINKHIAKKMTVFIQHIRTITKQNIRHQQQIVEVHRTRLTATTLITLVDITDQRHATLFVVFQNLFILLVGRTCDKRILGVRYTALHHVRLINLIIKLHLFHDRTQQALRVGSIVDGKIRREPDTIGFASQDT